MRYILVFLLFLVLFLGMRYLSKRRLKKESERFELISRQEFLAVTKKMLGKTVDYVTVGQDRPADFPYMQPERFLNIGLGGTKLFNGQEGPAWFIAIFWFWTLYDTSLKDERGMPKKVVAFGDNLNSIEQAVREIEGKKITDILIEDMEINKNTITSIKFCFEQYELVISMPPEGFEVCALTTPDDESFFVSNDEIRMYRQEC